MGFKHINRLRQDGLFALQMPGKLGHVAHGIYCKSFANTGLRRVLRGNKQFPASCRISGHRHGKNPRCRTKPPLQTQFPDKTGCLRRLRELSGSAQNADQNGKVIDRSFFSQIARSQIDGNPPLWKCKAAVFDGGAHSVPGFPHRRVRQTHHVKLRKSAAEIALAKHLLSLDSHDAARLNICNHFSIPPLL